VISQLTGTVSYVGATRAIITVSGVGFDVLVTATHALELRVGTEITLTCALIVREDSLTLYGFRDAGEREVFGLLTSVSGVGPKSAMGVLAQLRPDELATAVENEDIGAFKKVSGVGPKTAKLITVQLKGKLAGATAAGNAGGATVSGSTRDDVVEALVGLGTPQKQAQEAVERASEGAAAGADVPTLLRAALQQLGGAR
jgi:Holliday junction DNA helicase RuvA